MNYSADGARLAVASNDCKIYVYAARDGFAKLSTVAMHQSFVTHVDFSVDGLYVQSADGARSLLFADAATGIQIPSEFWRAGWYNYTISTVLEHGKVWCWDDAIDGGLALYLKDMRLVLVA